MPCHDILVQTAVQSAASEQINATRAMWDHAIDRLGIELPQGFVVYPNANGDLVFYSYGDSNQKDLFSAAQTRYKQTYVARQIFDAFQADGYEVEAWADPDAEGTWVVHARDVTRNATIGVVVYHTLEFEIDFLDALHDDSVWLAGGEFGRIIERLRSMGLSAEVVKLDVDDEAKRQIRQSNGLLA